MTPAGELLVGFAYGVALSAPIGPVAMLCIRRGFAGEFRLGLATGLGCGCCDLAVCWLVASGVDAVPIPSTGLLHVLEKAAGALLVGLSLAGIVAARKSRPESVSRDVAALGPRRILRAWTEGLAITLANPLNAGSVSIFAASLAANNRGIGLEATGLGLAAGILIWWLLLAWTAWMMRGRVGARILRFVDLAIAIGLGIAGMVVLGRTSS